MNITGAFRDMFVDAKYKLICGDTRETLSGFDSELFDLIITSPPYNIGKEYEVKESIESYLSLQEDAIEEMIRVLSPRGSICWQVGNYIDKGEVFPLDTFYYDIFKSRGLIGKRLYSPIQAVP